MRTNNEQEPGKDLQQKEKQLRNNLLGCERTEADKTRKLESAEELLAIKENQYAKKRYEYSSLQNVWFSSKTIMIAVAAFIVAFLIIALFSSTNIISITDTLFFRSPQFSSFVVALGVALIPMIAYIALNNVKLQRKNAEISIIYSEIMSLRNRITLLQEKILADKIATPVNDTQSSTGSESTDHGNASKPKKDSGYDGGPDPL